MSGHSKWHNIAAKKGKADAARGKIFTKLGRELLMAVRSGGPDINSNSKLKDVVAKCKANNMPNDTIDKAIKRAAGDGNQENYEEVIYEGYGPNGVAIIVNATTDNRNRTASDVRHIFDKFGGNLGTNGCVSYLFDRKGVIVIEKEETNLSEDDLMLLAIEAGAENFEAGEDYYEITTTSEDFSTVRETLEKEGLTFAEADVQMIPQTYITLEAEPARKMGLLIENLEDLDDVIEVYHNWEE
ncbi:MAG: YebC/PmpR family DNA-binding transcriptional regulator [Clostridia bacterium]|nr:YebC/PmpR family DNA-binding transcriptional regulator [Clostridia bacterium]